MRVYELAAIAQTVLTFQRKLDRIMTDSVEYHPIEHLGNLADAAGAFLNARVEVKK